MGRGRGLKALMLVAAVGFAAMAAGCGGGPSLTASELIDRVNQQGVSIELGPRLPATGGARELYAVKMPPLPGEPPAPRGSGSGPGANGSLYDYGDTGAADHELRACRASGGLLCFQAGNIVVVLSSESSRIEVTRLAEAMQRLR